MKCKACEDGLEVKTATLSGLNGTHEFHVVPFDSKEKYEDCAMWCKEDGNYFIGARCQSR